MNAIKYLDAFPKAYDEFRVKTKAGAVVSIISVVLMTIIFFSELRYYMKIEIEDHLYVNSTNSPKLDVYFDFSFPEISCSLLSLDAIDETGLPQNNLKSEIYKHQLIQGEKHGNPTLHSLGDTVRKESEIQDSLPPALSKNEPEKTPEELEDDVKYANCGNCYGARPMGECCNTCDDVKKAYKKLGWHLQIEHVRQCRKQVQLDNWKANNAEEGGCQLYGMIELNKASGHFHIAPHKKLKAAGAAVGIFDFLELISFAFSQFNITHTINYLSFGNPYPGLKNPLDSQKRVIQDTHGMYQYYIKIVPTIYKTLHGKEMNTNQYAVTEHMRHLAPGSGRGLPGIYFYYEISPVQSYVQEKRGHGGFIRFLTSMAAVLGGSYTIFAIIDKLVGSMMEYYRKGLLQ